MLKNKLYASGKANHSLILMRYFRSKNRHTRSTASDNNSESHGSIGWFFVTEYLNWTTVLYFMMLLKSKLLFLYEYKCRFWPVTIPETTAANIIERLDSILETSDERRRKKEFAVQSHSIRAWYLLSFADNKYHCDSKNGCTFPTHESNRYAIQPTTKNHEHALCGHHSFQY